MERGGLSTVIQTVHAKHKWLSFYNSSKWVNIFLNLFCFWSEDCFPSVVFCFLFFVFVIFCLFVFICFCFILFYFFLSVLLSICFIFYFLMDIILPDLSEFNVEFTPTFMLSSNVHIKTIRTSIEIFSKMHCAVRRRHLNIWCVLNRFSWNVISKTHYQYFFETIQLLKHIWTVY